MIFSLRLPRVFSTSSYRQGRLSNCSERKFARSITCPDRVFCINTQKPFYLSARSPCRTSFWQRSENINLVLLAYCREPLKVRWRRLEQDAFFGGHSHLEHHSHKPDFRARNDMYEEMSFLLAAASQPVGHSAWKKDVSARSQYRLLSIAYKSEFSIQHIEGLVFQMVKVVRRLKARRRGEMDQRIRSTG